MMADLKITNTSNLTKKQAKEELLSDYKLKNVEVSSYEIF